MVQNATLEAVQRAILEHRLRVDCERGRIETRRPEPAARWKTAALEIVRAPHIVQGYHRVTFATSAGRFRGLAHRVVWFAAGRTIPAHLEIDHKDTNKFNNTLGNLELVTRGVNMQRAHAKGLHPGLSAALDKSLFTDDQVRAMRAERALGAKLGQLVAKYGSDPSTISKIVRGLTYRDVR